MSSWAHTKQTGNPKKFLCPHCNSIVSSDEYYYYGDSTGRNRDKIYICPNCYKPTFFEYRIDSYNSAIVEKQYPGSKYGDDVKKLTPEIENIWNEIRNAYSANCFNAVAMLTRAMLLMVCLNIDKTGKINENSKFIECVDYLVENSYVPKNSKTWVDELRKIANQFTHEIVIVTKEQAKKLIDYSSMLLKLIYEFSE